MPRDYQAPEGEHQQRRLPQLRREVRLEAGAGGPTGRQPPAPHRLSTRRTASGSPTRSSTATATTTPSDAATATAFDRSAWIGTQRKQYVTWEQGPRSVLLHDPAQRPHQRPARARGWKGGGGYLLTVRAGAERPSMPPATVTTSPVMPAARSKQEHDGASDLLGTTTLASGMVAVICSTSRSVSVDASVVRDTVHPSATRFRRAGAKPSFQRHEQALAVRGLRRRVVRIAGLAEKPGRSSR